MTTARITHLIAGSPWEGTAERTSDVYNPATGEVTGILDLASADLVDEVVAGAKQAWRDSWGSISLAKRTQVLFKFRELLDRDKQRIAELITREHGKVLDDALGEVTRGLEVAEFACGIPHLLKGGFTENASTGVDVYSIRQSLGVVAVISPFNFPAMVPLWFVPVAVACGNAVVIKPSEKDPSATIAVAELWKEAGLPDGVMNVVNGDKEAVDALLVNPDVKAISFVGSTPIARYVYETGTAHGKRVQALGGAKNHMLVLPDADLDLAADAAINAGFGSAGERCMAISALVAVDSIADDLVGTDQGPDGQAPHRRRHPRQRHGSAGDRAAPREGRVLHRRGRRGRCRARRRRAHWRVRCRRRRLLPRTHAVRPGVPARCRSTPTRSSARSSRSCASRRTTKGWS